MVKIFEDTFIRFDRIHERDRHTNVIDTQTPHDDRGHVCIASRGKNVNIPQKANKAMLALISFPSSVCTECSLVA